MCGLLLFGKSYLNAFKILTSLFYYQKIKHFTSEKVFFASVWVVFLRSSLLREVGLVFNLLCLSVYQNHILTHQGVF